MSTPIPDTLGQIPPTPISGGNQCDEFEGTLSDDEAIITFAQGTENGISKAIADALSDVEEVVEEVERTYLIDPPPPGIHSSKQAAINACNDWGGKHGYALTIKKSKKSKKTGQYYLHHLCCSRGKVPAC
jgi:hypothetical protein